MGINDPRTAAALDLIRSKSLSSDQRLYLSLWGSTLLKTTMFEAKKKIITAGSLIEEGYLIISGSLVGVEGDHIYRFGPGSVLGLAEGVINHPSKMSGPVLMAKPLPNTCTKNVVQLPKPTNFPLLILRKPKR